MLLTGTFARSVDDKLRIALPKRLRDAMAVDENSHLYITPGTDGSLAIYREDTLAAIAARLAAASPTQRNVRDYNRLFYAQAECVELDSQGRMRVPPALAKLAALEREAVLVGVHDHLELWDRSRWEAYLSARSTHYDEIAERAFQNPRA